MTSERPEPLDAGTIRDLCPAPIAVEVVERIGSTNAELFARARHGIDIHRVALFAEQQSAGRGRRGRGWVSPPGANLYLSLGWRLDGAALEGLSLVAGVAVARALRRGAGVEARLKWPNDVLVDGRKLGGILVEVNGDAGGALDVVIGVGLNLALPANVATTIDQPWTDLQRAGGRNIERNTLAATVLDELCTAIETLVSSSFAAFRAEWNALDALHGRDVMVSGLAATLAGRALGVDEHGALRVLDAGGMLHTVMAGEVSVRAQA